MSVIFTETRGSLAAFQRARELGASLDARIRILMPHVVPFPLPLDRPAVDPLFRVGQFRDICIQDGVDTEIEIRLCRDPHECVRDWLKPESIVVIGCSKSWFARENCLARCLRRLGHHVIGVSNWSLKKRTGALINKAPDKQPKDRLKI